MSTHPNTPLKADRAEIARAVRLLYHAGDVVEIRVPKAGRSGTISGYFDGQDALIKAIPAANGRGPGVYATLNPVNPALLARAYSRLKERAEATTTDSDVLCRRWMLIDIDATRPSGISSTDEEHEAALLRAEEIRDALRKEGWPDPLLGDSGNGGHLLFRLPDLPNDAASTELVKRILEALGNRFSDHGLEVDPSVCNASRVTKAFGTVAGKGDSIPGRPHRLARLLEIPEKIQPVPLDLLEALAAQAPGTNPPPPPRAEKPGTRKCKFDVEKWIAEHGLKVTKVTTGKAGGRKFILDECPFQPEDHGGNPFIEQLPNGALVFNASTAIAPTKTGRRFESSRSRISRLPVAKPIPAGEFHGKGHRERRDRRRSRDRQFDLVVFWSLDRFSREGVLETLQHLQRLTKNGVDWFSFREEYLRSTGPFRYAVLAILAAVAKQERVRISERVTAGLMRARAQGKRLGRPKAQVGPERVRALRKRGLSLRQIAGELAVSPMTVQRILKERISAAGLDAGANC